MRGCYYKYSSHINFYQNLDEFASELPRKVSSVKNLIIVRRRDTTLKPKVFIVNKKRVEQALLWLKAYNKRYSDITINLAQLDEIDGDVGNVLELLSNEVFEENEESNKDQPSKDPKCATVDACEEDLAAESSLPTIWLQIYLKLGHSI